MTERERSQDRQKCSVWYEGKIFSDKQYGKAANGLPYSLIVWIKAILSNII